MRLEARKLLIDAISAGRAVTQFVSGRNLDDYRADLLLRSAVERQLFVLGEALTQMRSVDPAAFESIPDARRIVGLRNVLAHGYSQIDDARIWDVVQSDLPGTIRALVALEPEP